MTATYIKLNGTEGMQFGKKFYNITLKFHELIDFLEVFQDVQRNIDRTKVNDIANYVLKGLKEGNTSFLTSLTTTCRGDILYNHTKEEINIDVESVLSINDGQHRYRGILKAISMLEKEMKKEKDKNIKFIINRKLEMLKNMEMPIVIFAGLDEDMEKQLFHDLNNLSKKPTKSISLKFDQNNLYTRIAKYVARNNEFFRQNGVEFEKASISAKNPNTFLLTSITNAVAYLITGTNKNDHEILNDDNYEDIKIMVDETFTRIGEMLPNDADDKEKYMFSRAYVLQGIAKFVYNARNKGIAEDDILIAIGDVDWTYSDKWLEFGAKKEKGNITFSGSGTGINAVYRAINANLEPITIG